MLALREFRAVPLSDNRQTLDTRSYLSIDAIEAPRTATALVEMAALRKLPSYLGPRHGAVISDIFGLVFGCDGFAVPNATSF
jgi:hypothetical protein